MENVTIANNNIRTTSLKMENVRCNYLLDASNLTINNSYIGNINREKVEGTITNTEIVNVTMLKLEGGGHTRIISSKIRNVQEFAIFVGPDDELTIENTVIENIGNYGIVVKGCLRLRNIVIKSAYNHSIVKYESPRCFSVGNVTVLRDYPKFFLSGIFAKVFRYVDTNSKLGKLALNATGSRSLYSDSIVTSITRPKETPHARTLLPHTATLYPNTTTPLPVSTTLLPITTTSDEFSKHKQESEVKTLLPRSDAENGEISTENSLSSEALETEVYTSTTNYSFPSTSVPTQSKEIRSTQLPSAKDAATTIPSLPTAKDAATTIPSLPTAKDTATTIPPLPTSKDAATTIPPLPTAKDAATTISPLPTVKDAATTIPPLPTARDAGTTISSLSTAKDARTTISSLSTAKDAATTISSLPTAKDAATTIPPLPTAKTANATFTLDNATHTTQTSDENATVLSVVALSTESTAVPDSSRTHSNGDSYEKNQRMTKQDMESKNLHESLSEHLQAAPSLEKLTAETKDGGTDNSSLVGVVSGIVGALVTLVVVMAAALGARKYW